jgi:large subunit ribosomal protein L22
MPGTKTNERPGTRAVLKHYRMSASKARQVLDLIRDQEVGRANELLRTTEREAANVVGKVLASAVANAVHNEGQDAEDLYVSACYADEGSTLKRWRPRARGRASRIRKRTCHITVIVSRLPDDRLVRRRAEREVAGAQRSRRVSESRRRADLSGRLSRRRHAQEEAAAAAAEAEAQEAADEAEVEDDLVEDAVTEQSAEDIVDDAGAEDGVPDADDGAQDGAPEAEAGAEAAETAADSETVVDVDSAPEDGAVEDVAPEDSAVEDTAEQPAKRRRIRKKDK